MAIYRLKVWSFYKEVHNDYSITQNYFMSYYILAPELNKIAFSSQLASNFSELIVDLFNVFFSAVKNYRQCQASHLAFNFLLHILQSPKYAFVVSFLLIAYFTKHH